MLPFPIQGKGLDVTRKSFYYIARYIENMQENNSAKIIVRVDPEIADLIPGYLANREKDIATIYDALEKKDLDTICIIGHSIKGSGGGYGFDAITDIGMLMEKAAKDGSTETIRLQVKRLEDYLLQIEIVYE